MSGDIGAVIGENDKETGIEVDQNGKDLNTHDESKGHSLLMKKYSIAVAIFVATNLTALASLDTAKIDQLTGLKGKMNAEEGVYKVTFPRDDVKVSVAGWQMPPFMGLGTWAAFQGTNDKAMMMGDTV